MNILMVTERYLPIWGGAENQLRQLVPHLTELGCNVTILTRRWNEASPHSECIDNTEVRRVGVPGSGWYATISFLITMFIFIVRRRNKIDILHSHGAINMGAFCTVMSILLRKKNVTKIATAGRLEQMKGRLAGKLIISLFRKSSAIISMTQEIDNELRAIDVEKGRVKRITNGVDGERFKPYTEQERTLFRRHCKLPDNSLLVLFSGRLVPRKGLDQLLDAWPAVSRNYPDAWLLVVGSGTDQPDSVEAEMRNRIRAESIPQVKLLGETSSPEKYLGVVDLFVFPSKKEGFPNVLMEALAASLPVIAADIGGVTDIVTDERIGTLFRSGDSRDLSEKLISFLETSKLKKERSLDGRNYMLKDFSFGQIAGKYHELYRELLT